VAADDDWLSNAWVTLRAGLADGLDGELGDGLVWEGLKFELGEGFDGWLDARRADVTAGELESRTVVSAALNPDPVADVDLAGCDDVADPVDPGAGHICFGQVTIGLRVSWLPVLAVSRIRATASATSTTVGKITAQK
jgi:hypothetical protein